LPGSNKTSEVEDDPSYDRNKDLYWAINLTKPTEN
jgi:hypothetical protein